MSVFFSTIKSALLNFGAAAVGKSACQAAEFGMGRAATVIGWTATAIKNTLKYSLEQSAAVYRPREQYSCYLIFKCETEDVQIGTEPNWAGRTIQAIDTFVHTPLNVLYALGLAVWAVRRLRHGAERASIEEIVPPIILNCAERISQMARTCVQDKIRRRLVHQGRFNMKKRTYD